MLRKKNLPVLVLLTIAIELLIYLWAYTTSQFEAGNFFAIEPSFIFDKCARNSGRISSALNLAILIMIGYLGLRTIFENEKLKNNYSILVTLFTVNHLCHFFFVYQTFKHHTMTLSIGDNLHGFITFMLIILFPVIIWTSKRLSMLLHIGMILHLFNVSYFIMETFYNKIKPDKPAYHNQFGIAITCLACIYVVYGFMKDYRPVSKKTQ